MTSSNESLRPASSKALGVGDQANLRLWWRLCLRSFTEFMFFFFRSRFLVFFFVFGVFGASEVLVEKRWWKACWTPFLSKSLEFSVLRKKHSRKVFIFQFLLGESGEAPEMKSHVWKLRFCSLKLGEKNRGTSQGLTAKGETSCEIKGTAWGGGNREMSGEVSPLIHLFGSP